MTTTEVSQVLRRCVLGLAVSASLLAAPFVAAKETYDRPTESAASSNAKAFGQTVKRDAKTVGAACREGAHRVVATSKAVAHKIAVAAKRGVDRTRAALHDSKGENAGA